MGVLDNYSVDQAKQGIIQLLLVLAVVGFILAILAPNVLGASDFDVTDTTAIRTSLNACSDSLVAVASTTNQTYQSCIASQVRMNKLADGYKLYVTSTFFLATAINLVGTYFLIKHLLKK